MRTELKDRGGSLEYINHAGQDLLRKASAEQSPQRLRPDLENLNARWNKVLAEIEDRHSKFAGASEQLKHLRVIRNFTLLLPTTRIRYVFVGDSLVTNLLLC